MPRKKQQPKPVDMAKRLIRVVEILLEHEAAETTGTSNSGTPSEDQRLDGVQNTTSSI